jgi:hypothetical protein
MRHSNSQYGFSESEDTAQAELVEAYLSYSLREGCDYDKLRTNGKFPKMRIAECVNRLSTHDAYTNRP